MSRSTNFSLAFVVAETVEICYFVISLIKMITHITAAVGANNSLENIFFSPVAVFLFLIFPRLLCILQQEWNRAGYVSPFQYLTDTNNPGTLK